MKKHFALFFVAGGRRMLWSAETAESLRVRYRAPERAEDLRRLEEFMSVSAPGSFVFVGDEAVVRRPRVERSGASA